MDDRTLPISVEDLGEECNLKSPIDSPMNPRDQRIAELEEENARLKAEVEELKGISRVTSQQNRGAVRCSKRRKAAGAKTDVSKNEVAQDHGAVMKDMARGRHRKAAGQKRSSSRSGSTSIKKMTRKEKKRLRGPKDAKAVEKAKKREQVNGCPGSQEIPKAQNAPEG